MKTDTRQKLIDSAVRRFYRDGFRNVGIDQIMADVGISKTAFYKHFESKDELMLAVLESQNAWLQQTFRDMAAERGGPDPVAQLRTLMDVVDRIIHDDAFQGCMFVNVSMEFPLAHDPAHVAAARHKHAIEALVEELALKAGASDPRALARDLCLVMEGAYVTRQVTGDTSAIVAARRVADAVLDAHLAR